MLHYLPRKFSLGNGTLKKIKFILESMSRDVSEACMLLWSDNKTVSSVLFSLAVKIFRHFLDVVKGKVKTISLCLRISFCEKRVFLNAS